MFQTTQPEDIRRVRHLRPMHFQSLDESASRYLVCTHNTQEVSNIGRQVDS